MMNIGNHDTISTAMSYFKQQSELYGRQFIFSKPEMAEIIRNSSCMNYEKLSVMASQCSKCALSAGRQHVVFGTGNLKAKVMLIGEAVGALLGGGSTPIELAGILLVVIGAVALAGIILS